MASVLAHIFWFPKNLYNTDALIGGPLALVVILIFAHLYKAVRLADKPYKKYFLSGLYLRILGGIGFALVHAYILTRADTYVYYRCIKILHEHVAVTPFGWLDVIFAAPGAFELPTSNRFFFQSSSLLVVKAGTLAGLPWLNSYWAITFTFGTFAFSGMWVLFLAFRRIYPKHEKLLAYAILYFPSVFFWGSGLMKDTLVIGSIGWLTFSVLKIVYFREGRLLYGIIGLVSITVISIVKAYVIIGFLPSTAYLVYRLFKDGIKNEFVRKFSTPILLTLFALIGYNSVDYLSQAAGKFALENVLETAMVYQDYHTKLIAENRANSSYHLDFEPTVPGIIKVFPEAVNVTLFRPYVWEAKSLPMLISAAESSLILVITLIVLFKVGLRKSLSIAINHPLITFCLLFSILFAFAIGFSTFNFGSLSRYRIPLLPFFIAALSLIYGIGKEESSTSAT